MGVGTILEARRIRVVALGEHKAEVVARLVRGADGAELPASYLVSPRRASSCGRRRRVEAGRRLNSSSEELLVGVVSSPERVEARLVEWTPFGRLRSRGAGWWRT